MTTKLMTLIELNECLLMLRNMIILRDLDRRVIVVRDDGIVCLRAIEKVKGYWMVRLRSTSNVRWERVMR